MDYGQFEKVISVKREMDETCHFEVCRHAMDIYKKLYKDDYDKAIFFSGDKHKLKRDGLVFTADILTEIKSPVKKLVQNTGRIKSEGWRIREDILNCELDDEIDIRILPWLKTFAYVYYWTGNMMPVIKNPMGLGSGGTWRNKILFLMDKKEEKHLQKDWENWRLTREELEKEYYFADVFSSDNSVKSFYDNDVKKDVSEVYFSKKYELEEKIQWFANNAKLIIQRSYRIKNNIKTDYDLHQCNEIKDLIRYVFEKNGASICGEIKLF